MARGVAGRSRMRRLPEEVMGGNEMRAWGGKVVLVALLDGAGTNAILRRVIESLCSDSREFAQ